MNETKRGFRASILCSRIVMMILALVIVGQMGCGSKPAKPVVQPEEMPAPQAKAESSIRWSLTPFKEETVVKNESHAPLDGKAAAKKSDRRPSLFNGGPATGAPAPGAPPPPPPPPPPPSPDLRGVDRDKSNDTKDRNVTEPRVGQPTQDEERSVLKMRSRIRSEKVEEAIESNEIGSGSTLEEKRSGKPPQVWKRDRQRPTFARVYVGDGNSLELVSLNVSVTIEGPRARTVVDHVYRNPHDRRLEGTFEYPLPSGASPSYFAMFLGQSRETAPPLFARRDNQPAIPAEALARMQPTEMVAHVDTTEWGTLREARIFPREQATEVYETIVRSQIDPALLEYAGGNTFSGRVFPIQPKGFNRVILAYEELLPISGEKALYRFPLPDCKLTTMQLSLQANGSECTTPVMTPQAEKKEAAGRLSYDLRWKDKGPGGDVSFAFTPAQPQIQAIAGRQGKDGPVYLYARVRPQLEARENYAFAEHAVFLLDTSLSEHPDRFAVNMKLFRKILESDAAIKHFNILAFNVGAAWVEPTGWIANTAEGREKALKRLDGIVLEGATDLSAALEKLARPSFQTAPATPINVFLLSDGQVTWGEPEVGPLVARFEAQCTFPTRFHCYRTGLGADNQELFDALTRKGGGVFNCFTEPELSAAAQAHRNQCFQVERVSIFGGPGASEVLVAGRKAAIYPGGEIVVAGKLSGPVQAKIVLEGTFLGQKRREEYTVEGNGASELAPRGWGEIAVASLQSVNDPNLDSLITAYCQQFGIGGKTASFLVLENDADYKRFDLDKEHEKALPGGDLALFLDTTWQTAGKLLPPREVLERFLARIEPRVKLLSGEQSEHVKKMLALLTEKDFETATVDIEGALLHKSNILADYLKARDKDRREVGTYLAEAQRRADAKNTAGAVRVLSSIIEEYPGRADALRLVGYRLMDMGMSSQAIRLFQQVERNRPFEPHSYRDLARSLEESGKFGLAAMQYEILLAGTWDSRFHDALKLVVREEYARMMQDAIRQKKTSKALSDHFGERLEKMKLPSPRSDLRVTISWNTDATDIDLWVFEPDGTKCFYSHNKTKLGGDLSQDQTQGYGPERYQIEKAPTGEFIVVVDYCSTNRTLLGGETHVNVVVAKFAGTPQEVVERRTVVLKKNKEQIEVCRIKY